MMIRLRINMVTTQDLFFVTNSLMYEIKTEEVYEYFSKGKEVFNFNDCLEYYDD